MALLLDLIAGREFLKETPSPESFPIDHGNFSNRITKQSIKNELNEFRVELKDVGVSDITADEGYVAKLKEKAVNIVAAEVAAQKTLQLKEQLKQEQQQTEVEKEIARRDNIVAAERNKVYALNPQAFQLEKLKLWKDIVGEKDKFWLIQLNSGTDLNLFMNSDGKFVPLNQ